MQNQPSVNLQALRQAITLSNSDLNDLAHNHQKFVGTIRKFNNQAKAKIIAESPKEALVYLTQAQKILEYAASCGKNIDRNMIVCILHNEACCYQKLWQLQKCSNYLEALIFNISSHLKTSTPSPREVEDYIKTSGSLSSHLRDSLYGKPINQRIQLSKYHLQFCAINSQLRNHKGALISGRRAIAIIKDIFQQLQTLSIQKSTIENNYSPASMYPQQPEQDYQTKLHLISGLATINDQPSISRLQNYIVTAKYYFRKWNIRKHEQNNDAMKQSLKNFSIGSIMQIKPIGFQENKQSTMDNDYVITAIYQEKYHADLLKTQNLQKVINHVLLLTIGYFTIATQLRLISSQKHRNCEQTRKKSPQYIQSQIYHIISLIVTAIYVPYDMVYMRHILTSFSNHYSGNLNQSLANQQESLKVLSKQFDPCSYCQGKKKKTAKTTKTYQMDNNREMALEIVDSVKIIDRNIQTHNGNINNGKNYQKKNKSHSKSKSKKPVHKNKNGIKNSSKHRTNSQQLIRIEDGGVQNKKTVENTDNRKVSERKGKVKSLSQKHRKSTSKNNSKNKRNQKKQQDSQSKHRQQYYKHRRNLEKSKSPRSTAKKREIGRMQKSQHNLHSQTHIKSQKVLLKSGNSGSIKIQKKKAGPVKKNLDRYYF